MTALLFVWLGWRGTWSVFGVITLLLIVIPALVFMRRSPEDMGLRPDGDAADPAVAPAYENHPTAEAANRARADETVWNWREVMRTDTFWIVCFIYGMVNVGIAGLNLHVFAYVTDVGFSTAVGATVLSIIAGTQLGSTLVWGFLGERLDIRYSSLLMFCVQALGLALAIATSEIWILYAGFLLYGAGLGGGWVLQELIWANYYGRLSLGTVRGAGILVTHGFGAAGAPFFGFIHDATGSYMSSFIAFICALALSALLSLVVRAPRKPAARLA